MSLNVTCFIDIPQNVLGRCPLETFKCRIKDKDTCVSPFDNIHQTSMTFIHYTAIIFIALFVKKSDHFIFV